MDLFSKTSFFGNGWLLEPTLCLNIWGAKKLTDNFGNISVDLHEM